MNKKENQKERVIVIEKNIKDPNPFLVGVVLDVNYIIDNDILVGTPINGGSRHYIPLKMTRPFMK